MAVDGFLMPWSPQHDQPLFIRMTGCDDWFVPIFSTDDKLYAHIDYLIQNKMLEVPITLEADGPVLKVLAHRPYTIKQVNPGGGAEFLGSIFEAGVRVMADPYVTPQGTIRWNEIVFEGDETQYTGDLDDRL